ncbi:TetR/AcrR family transcriptional regulator [Paenibacillus sp. P96]|uniref:TetR/AcrR family transcriptional regulator n=1 Tax=Paenibacillus zeirhizosphaerae TaxID=2987519 RepID=A0ABT9FTK7_9BACL|nr:TetR/AcrR family transcriptional regulator [Paenibacillus sp. P96]MDP4097797.1 TetR/AcrR family transcriptional regulator [Paenibacillus sp. P96]
MARHKEFDMTEVLDRAMDHFWRHGYDGTSMQELVHHVGIKAQSLYNAFGGKRDLYFAALKHYVNQGTVISTLEQTPSGKEAITNVFYELLADLDHPENRARGCFISNTCVELAPHDTEIAAFIERERIRMEDAYYLALTRARQQGDLGARYRDLRALARFLQNSHGGLMVTAKAATDMTVLKDIVSVTLSIFE